MSTGDTRSPSSSDASDGRRVRLLVVDDNRDLAMALHFGLADHPEIESIGWVDSSDLIVETVVQQAPDVVLLDLTMPGTDPLDALAELRTRGIRAIVVAFSGYDDEATITRAKSAGADAFLGKHSDPEEIAAAILRAMRRAGRRAGDVLNP